jgi:iron complex transport system ATP-binding protein
LSAPGSPSTPSLRLVGVGLVRDGRALVDGIDLTVQPDERWVVLGANGSGKTSLLRIAGLQLHPSTGEVEVLGQRLGRVDIRRLRPRIGFASAAVSDSLRADLSALDVVMTAKHAALEPWWHQYDDADRAAARRCLDRLAVGALADRTFGTLSSGERQRVLVARTLMGDAGLVLLDEPTAGLDLGGRERLLAGLAAVAADPDTPGMVFVTHHVEEIPPHFTHALILQSGRALANGPLADVLHSRTLSDAFGLPVRVRRRSGRWSATAA